MTIMPVLLLTGGTGSIGLAIAEAAIAAGWQVALHGSSEASVTAAIGKLADAGVPRDRLLAVPADVKQAGAVETIVASTAAWADRIDAVVDCVATGPAARIAGLFAETEPAGYAPFMEYSIVHLQFLAFATLPWLQKRGGTLIAFASDAGKFAAPRQALIGASRAAIMGFVRNLATEVARDGVRVHCISPSFVDDTDSARRLAARNADRMEKARRRAGLGLPTPADIAPLVLFLCGDGARRITGQVISVNGGINA